MAHPTASSSQPAQIPALDSPHAGNKAPKEKKGQGKPTNASEASPFPLEVRFLYILTNLDQLTEQLVSI
jgi:threonyl-tRNA synthetase